ncbi:hypothetical protein HDV05_003512 [Chytridiales sp. JEL 0842]|nr:hypothetical protein HDV05_003512 [Chytridiales sp. JEL 0842]
MNMLRSSSSSILARLNAATPTTTRNASSTITSLASSALASATSQASPRSIHHISSSSSTATSTTNSKGLSPIWNQKRFYAEKVAKTGQKKAQQRDEDAGEPLPPFYPKPAPPEFPDVRNISPQELGYPYHPRGHKPGRRLLREIDLDHRARHDFDNRTKMFAEGSPDAVEPGSVILVEQASSRSSPRKLMFAGVLMAVKRKGILSSITVRNYVLGTGIEMVFPIYSPMVTRIKVLKKVEGFSGGKHQVYFLRKTPSKAPMAFGKIADMVMREQEGEARREQNRKLK